jgi:MFS superfamily sulfate permease-like transporter
MLLGFSCIALILVVDYSKRFISNRFNAVRFLAFFPTNVLLVVLTTVLSWAMDFEGYGIAILGQVDSGLPIPWLPLAYNPPLFRMMVIPALTVSIVGFVESTAVAKV